MHSALFTIPETVMTPLASAPSVLSLHRSPPFQIAAVSDGGMKCDGFAARRNSDGIVPHAELDRDTEPAQRQTTRDQIISSGGLLFLIAMEPMRSGE